MRSSVPSTTNDWVYWTRGIERVGATSPAHSCSWPQHPSDTAARMTNQSLPSPLRTVRCEGYLGPEFAGATAPAPGPVADAAGAADRAVSPSSASFGTNPYSLTRFLSTR